MIVIHFVFTAVSLASSSHLTGSLFAMIRRFSRLPVGGLLVGRGDVAARSSSSVCFACHRVRMEWTSRLRTLPPVRHYSNYRYMNQLIMRAGFRSTCVFIRVCWLYLLTITSVHCSPSSHFPALCPHFPALCLPLPHPVSPTSQPCVSHFPALCPPSPPLWPCVPHSPSL